MPIINIKPPGAKGAYTPYGGCLEFMQSRDHQIFLYGGTGTGKTTVLCWKMLMLCLKYPGCKFLFTRKSYRSLIKSGVETFERVVREAGLEIGKKPNQIQKMGDAEPREYKFPYSKRVDEDGRLYEGQSRIVLASLDKVKDELGAEYDFIYVNQPEQAEEDDWQYLTTRANGRYDHAPYPQIFGDPNPEHAQHWIKKGGWEAGEGQTKEDGRWRLIKSTYRDNPIIWDMDNNCLTKNGEMQIGTLMQSLSPVMARRLLDSEWASFEGLAYGEAWNRRDHTITQEKFAELYDITYWDRYWAIDFGYNDPFVCSMFAKHPEMDLYIRYKSVYMTNRTINEHAITIKNFTIGDPKPKLVVADRNPNEIAILSQALGLNIVSARKGPGSRKARVNIINDMLKKNHLLFVLDSVVEDDQRLKDLKKPVGFEEEVENIRWNVDKTSTNEDTLDGDDHEENAIGYLFTHLKAEQKIIKAVWI